MNAQDWKIQSNYLKNLLDSYGISVVVLIRFAGDSDKILEDLFSVIRTKTREEFTISGFDDVPIYHSTLFPILRSTFILPKDIRRKKECQQLIRQLQQDAKFSLEERIINAPNISPAKASKALLDFWDQINIPPDFKTKHSFSEINAPELGISDSGLLYLKYKSKLLQTMQSQLQETITFPFQKKDPLPKGSYHISLGYLKSSKHLALLHEVISSWPAINNLSIKKSFCQLTAYNHRSLNKVMKLVDLG